MKPEPLNPTLTNALTYLFWVLFGVLKKFILKTAVLAIGLLTAGVVATSTLDLLFFNTEYTPSRLSTLVSMAALVACMVIAALSPSEDGSNEFIDHLLAKDPRRKHHLHTIKPLKIFCLKPPVTPLPLHVCKQWVNSQPSGVQRFYLIEKHTDKTK